MGARAEYSLDGEGLPLPHLFVCVRRRNVQSAIQFFKFLIGPFWNERAGDRTSRGTRRTKQLCKRLGTSPAAYGRGALRRNNDLTDDLLALQLAHKTSNVILVHR